MTQEDFIMRLHKDMVKMVVDKLPVELKNLCEYWGNPIIIAGGFVRDVITGASGKDIDIFGVGAGVMAAASYDFNEAGYELRINANSYTYTKKDSIPIQFITRCYYENHEELINSFDWSICQAGVYFDSLANEWRGICSEQFWEDVLSNTMHYTAPDRDEDPGASVLRMMRFAERGYHVPEEDVAKCIGRMVAEIVPMDDSNADVGIDNWREGWTETLKGTFRHVGYAGKKGTKS
jgi:hypothetical protein